MASRAEDSDRGRPGAESSKGQLPALSEKPRLRFKHGGTLRPEADIYVERPADGELFNSLQRGDFAYVLAPRQIGKSSLCAHTARRLQNHGTYCATIDLTSIGTEVTLEQWYFGMIDIITSQFSLPDQDAVWEANPHLSAVHRFSQFLHREVLGRMPQRIVIFVDEIDVVRRLPFVETDFFAAIRAIYNARATDPIFDRLTFCLLGVATPQELTRDPQLTPFNVGHAIRLEDFQLVEAEKAFVPALSPFVAAPQRWLNAVFHWTDGHPYMTHKLCEAIARQAQTGDPESVVASLVDKFFIQRGRFEDQCLSNAEDRFINNVDTEELLGRMLRTYRQILDQRSIAVVGSNPAQMQLRLCGMVADRQLGVQRVLRVRNRVFASIFDHAWLREYETQRTFNDSFEAWLSNNRNPDFLPKGQALDTAVAWARGREDVEREQHEFIEAGLDAARREQESRLLAAQTLHRQELRQRAEKQRLRLGLLVVVLLAAIVSALFLYREARRQLAWARDREVTAIVASASEARDPLLTAQLLKEATRRLSQEEREKPRHEILRIGRALANKRVPRQEFRGPPFQVLALRARRGTSTLNAMYENGQLLRWSLGASTEPKVLTAALTPRRAATGMFSEDGRWAAMHVMDGGATTPSAPSAFHDELELHDMDGQFAPMSTPLQGCDALQVAFRRDGLLIMACGDGRLHAWQPSRGPVFTLSLPELQPTDTILSPSGEHVIVLWRIAERAGGTLYSLDARGQLSRQRELGLPGDRENLAAGFDEAGGLIAVKHDDGTIRLFRTAADGLVASCQMVPLAPSSRLKRLEPSPDGAYVRWLTDDNTTGTLSCKHLWTSREQAFIPRAYWQLPDGMIVASEKSATEHILRISRVTDRQELIDIATMFHPVQIKSITAQIQYNRVEFFATGLSDGTIRIWDYSDSSSLVIENASQRVFNQDYSHMAVVRTNSLVTTRQQYIETWNLLEERPRPSKIDCLKAEQRIHEIWLDRTGKHLVSLVAIGKSKKLIIDECTHETDELNFNIEKLLVRSDGKQLVILTQEKQVIIYNPELRSYHMQSTIALSGITDIWWLAGERLVLVLGFEESPYVLSLDNLPDSHRLLQEQQAVDAIAASPDGRKLTLATADRRLLRFSNADDFHQEQFLDKLESRTTALVVDQSGLKVVATVADKRNIILDFSVKPHEVYVKSVGEKIISIHPDGSYFAMKERDSGVRFHQPKDFGKMLMIESANFAVDNGRFIVEFMQNGNTIKLAPWHWNALKQTVFHSTDAALTPETRNQYSLDPEINKRWPSSFIGR